MKKIVRRSAAVFLAVLFACLSALGSALAANSPDPPVSPAPQSAGDHVLRSALVNTAQAKNTTVMVYMIGSDLESRRGLATDDLNEMMAADLGENVNLVVQTMGCTEWKNDIVRADTAERFTIENGQMILQDDSLGQLDSTDAQTLADFIGYCRDHYPANRNILLLWDHGSGPVYGYGYDEYQGLNESLTLDEIRSALDLAGLSFDFIGMDACLMGSLETCCALCPYSDYLVASEDFESCDGWSYQGWLSALGQDVSISTPELGKMIVDDFVAESEQAGEDGVLSMIDLRYAALLSATWVDFAYANDSALVSANYSWKATPTSRVSDPSQRTDATFHMDDYYVTDLLAVASTVNSEGAAPLASALSSAVVACATTDGDSYMTGVSVTLPYGNSPFYQSLIPIFRNCGFTDTYLEWLGTFADCLESDVYYDDWETWMSEWSSWEDYHQQQDNSAEWETWADEHQETMEGIIEWKIDDDSGVWQWDAHSQVYYCRFPNGDTAYQNPLNSHYYYHSASDDTWWQWRMRLWNWEQCDNPNYPVNPEDSAAVEPSEVSDAVG